ncbi:MAG: amidohydrolase family protein [Candidatus Poribacteria bacterium]|nr:amidohydrolase family protein [Candidatus Poribacteria bacterium]
MAIVDTHAHIYSEDIEKYPQISEPYLPPPGRGTIADLKNEVQTNNIDCVVIVQTFTVYQHDNRLTIDTVREDREWTTGVLNLDPFDDASVDVMEEARGIGVRGNRVSAGWPTDSTVLPEHRRLWEAAQRLGVVICALLNPPNCRSLANLLRAFPDVPVVLDHCANLKAADFLASDNLKTVLDLAQFENLHAKLSFVVTGSDEEFPCRDMFEMTRQIIAAYSPERCIWGSDFPTSLWIPKVTYQQHLEIFQEHLGLSALESAAILGGTAMKLWFS